MRARAPFKTSFGDDLAGAIPDGWKAGATRDGDDLATWPVTTEDGARSGAHALAWTRADHASESVFDLCWTDRARFEKRSLEVAFQARSGRMDQGGGPIWRVPDARNDDVCGLNPLESNSCVHVVENGERRQLASAAARVDPSTWHTIWTEHDGDRIQCALDGFAAMPR